MARRLLVLLVATAVLVAGCGGGDDEAAGDGELSGERITLAVGVDPIFTSIFVADEKGLFEEEGLNVQVQQFANAGEAADALVAGAVDVAGVPDYNLLARAGRAELAAFGVFVEDPGQYVKIAVREDLTDANEIEKLGFVPGTFSEYAGHRFLESEGVDPASVEFVPSGPPELPALLQTGDIDGFALWEPWPTRATEMGGKVLMPIEEFDLATILMLSTSDAWLESHEAEAKALLRALRAAGELVEDDPEDAAAVTEDAAKVPAALTTQAIGELEFGTREVSDDDREDFDAISEFLVERDAVDAKPDLDELLAEGFGDGS